MALEGIVGAAADDQLGKLGGEEAPQPADVLELSDLLGNTPFQRGVPFLHFRGEPFGRIVEGMEVLEAFEK